MNQDLEKLKKEYSNLAEKYSLPGFNELNKDFEIEELQERETDFLLRSIRRVLLNKNLAYIKFIEMFLNPSNSPMFFLAVINGIENSDKKLLNDLYLELSKHEIKSVTLDNFYEESKEADFIRTFHKTWQDVKVKFEEILSKIDKSLDNKQEKRLKGYLG